MWSHTLDTFQLLEHLRSASSGFVHAEEISSCTLRPLYNLKQSTVSMLGMSPDTD